MISLKSVDKFVSARVTSSFCSGVFCGASGASSWATKGVDSLSTSSFSLPMLLSVSSVDCTAPICTPSLPKVASSAAISADYLHCKG